MTQLLSRDPYVVLGLPRDAGDAAIRRRFLELARVLHPDRAAAAGSALADALGSISEPFVRVQQAYQQLMRTSGGV